MKEKDEVIIKKYLQEHEDQIHNLLLPIFYLKGKNIITILHKYPDTIEWLLSNI